ncbi:PPK2 family polyphosphate kinase [Pararoseomonas indoligenes]|uniref:Polyphosphate kinase 2 family protein n=1 Tax=Roseomonas indoligenes TaxID=2820811 RepID=A0A940MR08_9PROT|nr:PPK2 family polyphosphate kinase [Pararoseomonas indoligenes]MBP0491884.1 polyphosphate kinase 2 family protein [Pararoseomonas indoligenes]
MSKSPVHAFAEACRVTTGKGFALSHYPTDDNGGLDLGKKDGEAMLEATVARIAEQQGRLYADAHWSVLCIFQATDTAGKDGAIKHVFSGVNPAGMQVESFSAPSTLERSHGFLWRHDVALPRRGRIGVHNRSWYEEVLVPRVQPAILQGSSIPPKLLGPEIWQERLEDIASHERYLSRQGMLVLKFFLHLGEEEQRQRLLARIEEPTKNWKFQAGDLADRSRYADYMAAYEDAIRATAAPHAPWFVIPADRKWLARLLVAEVVASAMESLDLKFPELDSAGEAALLRARDALAT